MSLFDLLKRNKKDVFQDYADNMQPLQPIVTQDGVTLAPIQIEGGPQVGAQPQATPRKGLTLIDRLFGVQAAPTDNIELGTDTMNATISQSPRVGGLFNDIASGAKENYATGFAAPNLYENETPDGRKKGFGYRLGEGLGTIGRFLESPLGRGLLVAGIVGATGGNGLAALAYGGQAGSLNQRYRYQDKMFRNEMINNAQNSLRNSPEFNNLSDQEKQAIYNQLLTNPDGTIRDYNTLTDAEKEQFEIDYRQALQNRLYESQQEQLSNIANNINNMRGYVTDDVYNNFVKAQQLRDNADYRNMMANLQMQNNQALQDFRKDQAEYQRQKDIADRQDRAATRALTMRGQDLNYALGIGRLTADEQKENIKAAAKQEETNNVLHQLDVLQDLHSKLPQNKAPKGLKKATAIGTGVLNMSGLPSDQLAAFSGAKNIVTNMIARKIGGEKGVMTDRDFERAKQMTPNEFDTPAQAKAKVKAIYALMGVDYPNGGGTTKSGTKYKVIK